MRNKLIVGILGLTVVVVGIAAFAAFTAQIVNLEAHVEKEIEVAAVTNCVKNTTTGEIVCHEDTGNYGTVLPQELYDKKIEVTLSKSFIAGQTKFDDVVFAVMWECKQFDPEQDLLNNTRGIDNDLDGKVDEDPVGDANSDGAPGVIGVDDDGDGKIDEDSAGNEPANPLYLNDLDDDDDEDGLVDEDPAGPTSLGPDGWPDCRVNPKLGLDHNGDGAVNATDLPHGQNLDDFLRKYASVEADDTTRCLKTAPPAGVNDGSRKPPQKFVKLIGFGVINRSVADEGIKCFYHVKLLAPPCEGEFNPFTDPNGPNIKTTPCHFIRPSDDPQTWEHSADIGDDFKIQVIEHSLAPGQTR